MPDTDAILWNRFGYSAERRERLSALLQENAAHLAVATNVRFLRGVRGLTAIELNLRGALPRNFTARLESTTGRCSGLTPERLLLLGEALEVAPEVLCEPSLQEKLLACLNAKLKEFEPAT